MTIAFKRPPAPAVQWVTLPVPPTTNNRLRPGLTAEGKARLYLSRSTRAYKKLCDLPSCALRPVQRPADVRVTIVWYRADPLDGDLDNRIKSALDVLKGRAYADDSQIRTLHVDRDDTQPRKPRLLIRIEDLTL